MDQTQLPGTIAYRRCATVDDLVDAIERLVVRGAPALGGAGALGVAMIAATAERDGLDPERVLADVDRLRTARPTAVNLAWAVDRVAATLTDGPAAALAEANRILGEDLQANLSLAEHGASWLLERVERPRLRILTHCHTGALATCGWGTALGIIRTLDQRGRLDHVLADETRPLLQGARLTVWELQQEGIDVVLQVDAAAPSAIIQGMVDAVVVGADRISANGDVANKIGTLGLALAAREAGIPFVVAAPLSTIDADCPDGSCITIEERDPGEVRRVAAATVCPEGTRVRNPAFDVTPARLVSAIVTEAGVWRP